MALGIYLSVPFCRTKCTYCNFASDVFSRAVFRRYVDRVCADVENAGKLAQRLGAILDEDVDSIYLGGGTPTVLDSTDLERLFVSIRKAFRVLPQAEITVECAPGTLTPAVLDTFIRCGVNRVSLGVQSFVDQEAGSVGRLHKRATVLADIDQLRQAGISNINIDLIAGLPHQTGSSWEMSLADIVNCGAPHASVYMLEIDQDSRLGRELIAGGTRYHAHFVPDEDLTAELYEIACDGLNHVGIQQYEISNFTQSGYESRHNLKYWTRQRYIGFGVDAHSMLLTKPEKEVSRVESSRREAVRFSHSESLEQFVAGDSPQITSISPTAALEESFFLGLRLNSGVNLLEIGLQHGVTFVDALSATIADLVTAGLLEREGDIIRLTGRGRLLSNEVFASFIGAPQA